MPTPAKDGFNVKVAVSAAVLRHFVAKRLVLALIFPDAATQIAMFRSLRFANGTVYLHFLAFAHDRIPPLRFESMGRIVKLNTLRHLLPGNT
jgi:hypothetical protein